MRNLADFSRQEWRRLKPLDHFMIQICNDGLQKAFRLWKPQALERFLRDAGRLRGGNIGCVVAYEQPWTVGWLIRAAARNLKDAALLVFDNSRRSTMRVEIERVCREGGIPYLGLPPSPTHHPNRSHGMAMTWIYYNVVRALEPRTFSYIDHDLIPLGKTGLGEIPANQPFYGLLNVGKWAWSLWAGFCSYDFSAVRRLPLNFLNDFSRGLDTGGRNWPFLYKHFDHTRLRSAKGVSIEILDPAENSPHSLGLIDECWVHLGGAGYSGDFRKLLKFYEYVARATDDGATLQDLAVKPPSR